MKLMSTSPVATVVVVVALSTGLAWAGEGAAPPLPMSPPVTSIVYKAWNEEIRVDAKAMTIKHTETQYEYESRVSANVKSSKVVTLVDGKITSGMVQDLTIFVRRSGYMELGAVYGAPENRRYYPYRLEVTFKGRPTKTVEYRSNPSFEDEPESFKTVVGSLRALSERVRRDRGLQVP